MSVEIEKRCAQLLRELRRKKGLTLQECEESTHGALKAVVLGSYERGHRAISLARLAQLADFYQVPIEYFFTDRHTVSSSENNRLVFDLRRIRTLTELNPTLLIVKKYLASIAARRRDWNGEVISLRSSDSEVLSLMNEEPLNDLYQELRLAGFLFASEVSGRQNP
ncbi:Cro/C1-type helix-turn-helix domain [Candidatus Nanopelagicaceae bacterium]